MFLEGHEERKKQHSSALRAQHSTARNTARATGILQRPRDVIASRLISNQEKGTQRKKEIPRRCRGGPKAVAAVSKRKL